MAERGDFLQRKSKKETPSRDTLLSKTALYTYIRNCFWQFQQLASDSLLLHCKGLGGGGGGGSDQGIGGGR